MMQSLGQTQAGQSADYRHDAKNYEGQHQVFLALREMTQMLARFIRHTINIYIYDHLRDT